MKKATSRRSFLLKTALATTGVTLLSNGVSAAFANDIPFDGYNPYAETKTDLRTNTLADRIDVYGVIYNSTGKIPLQNASVEVWHLSPNSKKYRHRAKLFTNDLGEYSFTTEMPNRETGNPPKIFFKVTSQNKSYFTELILSSTGAHITGKHWQENKLPDLKLLPRTEYAGTTTSINFNITN
ncbi:hypothetical protein ULMS_10020 [Patiriisocius marinistellae]|uniref:Intradiol ring-cleavage dioxygenases domain-containing protein n=1 Tax=Patiriisocius marinistellae TaxID=2494560 RepID=A0A5J4FWD5_9FLAO|nr:hypothetical protein [Patiriisocius marinistellae]GEQ85494.1 hypothetical protein ULMS_10020 [Patiriisocius marinistellae]